jgi:6-phosphofructokinase 2
MTLAKPNILCISLTPALDRYISVKKLELGDINRFPGVIERAGGKSINGARAIQLVGGKPLVISALGGHRGDAIIDYAQKEGIDLLSVAIKSETRQYTEIWDESSQISTHLSERWSNVTPEEWASYIQLISEQIKSDIKYSAAVIVGGMPPGVDFKEGFALVKMFTDANISCFIDSTGDTLGPLIAANPTVVKINHHEASNFLGIKIESIQDALKACKLIISQGIKSCVITMEDQGVVGATASTAYHVHYNNKGLWPVGCGDSFLAAMVVKWAQGEPWLNTMIAGTAAATANAHCRMSGRLDMEIYKLGLEEVRYTQLS